MPKEPDSVRETILSLSPSSPPNSPIRAPLRIHFPDTTLTTPGTHLTRSATSTPPTFSVSASALDNLSFPNCDLSPTTSAASHADDGSSILSHSVSSPTGPRYVVAGLDLDPPFPSIPFMSPLLHSLQADLSLSLSTAALSPSDDFITLEAPTSDPSRGEVAPYMGPAPPGLSSPHRYVFMLWEQPDGVTVERIREEMGFETEAGEGGGGFGGGAELMSRVRWDQERFERRLGLGRVVAGNYFVC